VKKRDFVIFFLSGLYFFFGILIGVSIFQCLFDLIQAALVA
jgi:hypothetical protein